MLKSDLIRYALTPAATVDAYRPAPDSHIMLHLIAEKVRWECCWL